MMWAVSNQGILALEGKKTQRMMGACACQASTFIFWKGLHGQRGLGVLDWSKGKERDPLLEVRGKVSKGCTQLWEENFNRFGLTGELLW